MEPPRCPHPCLSFSRAEQDEQARPHPGSVGTDPCTAVNTAAGERSAGRLRVAQGHRQFTPAPLLPRTLPRWSGLRAGVAEDRSQRSGAVPELPDPVGLTRHRHTVSHRPGPRNRFLLPPCSGTARLCFAPCERPSPATHPRYPRDRSAPGGSAHPRPFSVPGAHRQQRVGSGAPGVAAAPSGLLVPYRERGTAAAALTLGRRSHLRRAAGSMARPGVLPPPGSPRPPLANGAGRHRAPPGGGSGRCLPTSGAAVAGTRRAGPCPRRNPGTARCGEAVATRRTGFSLLSHRGRIPVGQGAVPGVPRVGAPLPLPFPLGPRGSVGASPAAIHGAQRGPPWDGSRFPAATQQMAAPTRCCRRRKFKRLKARPGRLTGKKSAPFCQLHLGAEDVPESRPPPGAGGARLGGGCVGAESREFVAAVRHGAGGSPGLRDVGWENGHAGLGAPPARGSAASALLSAARSGCCRGMGVALLSREWGAEGLRTHSCRAPRGKPARLRCAE